jgi:D-3-phosphoglycerate dehydrogenase
MARILITDGLEENALESLKNMGHETVEQFFTTEELGDKLKDFDALIVRSATKVNESVLSAARSTGRLKLIIRAGVGVDNIDVAYAEKSGITVANTPNASSNAVAELAMAHMFALARFTYCSTAAMREGQWNKKEYEGIELFGKTLGLIGFGRIARQTARIARGIGMKVIYHTRSGRQEGCDDYTYVPFHELLHTADVISLHIPYDRAQGPLIGKKEFEQMKDGVYLVNCARGGVVCEDALVDALDCGKVAGAAIDVFVEEPTKNERLCRHGRVSLSPHIGASTVEAQRKIGLEIVHIIGGFFTREECIGKVRAM